MRYLTAILLLIPLFSSSAAIGLDCQSVKDAAARLACYDKSTAKLAAACDPVVKIAMQAPAGFASLRGKADDIPSLGGYDIHQSTRKMAGAKDCTVWTDTRSVKIPNHFICSWSANGSKSDVERKAKEEFQRAKSCFPNASPSASDESRFQVDGVSFRLTVSPSGRRQGYDVTI